MTQKTAEHAAAIARIRAWNEWLRAMPTAPTRGGEDAMLETAYTMVEDIYGYYPDIGTISLALIDEAYESEIEDDPRGDILSDEHWAEVARRLGAE